jgi:hypothetical protein
MERKLMLRRIALSLPLLAVLAAVGASAAPALERPGMITITDREVSRARVDGGKPGVGAGDVIFVRQQLYNKRIRATAIGHSELACTLMPWGSRSCTGTYFLPRGKIMVGGVFRYRALYEVAVLGGTGVYDNVGGTLTVTSLRGTPRRELLVFRLTI